jgi:hypothetical protein
LREFFDRYGDLGRHRRGRRENEREDKQKRTA